MATKDATLDAKLHELVSEVSNARPYVCKGRPEECDVFIVGANPATSMEKPFTDFWNRTDGFKRDQWLTAYEAFRQDPKARGKRGPARGKHSPTRARIERVVAAAKRLDVKVLETNVFAKPSRRLADLSRQERVSKFFWHLYETVEPKVMVVHGNAACRVVNAKLGTTLDPKKGFKHRVRRNGCVIIAIRHLCLWSYDDATKLGSDVASLVASGGDGV